MNAQPIDRYFDSTLNSWVNVYEEKKEKRSVWMRGEAFLSQKMRIEEDDSRCFVQFSRKNGKY